MEFFGGDTDGSEKTEHHIFMESPKKYSKLSSDQPHANVTYAEHSRLQTLKQYYPEFSTDTFINLKYFTS